MCIITKDGRLMIETSGGSAEEFVNKIRAIIRTLQKACINDEDCSQYFLLELLNEMIPEPCVEKRS